VTDESEEVESFEGLVVTRYGRFRVRDVRGMIERLRDQNQTSRFPIVPFRHHCYLTKERMIEIYSENDREFVERD
jgi:hypothetical protein